MNKRGLKNKNVNIFSLIMIYLLFGLLFILLVVGVNIDFTNAIRVLDSNVSVAKVSIEYTDFGLVDDFSF
jgi:hypothetical protein